MWAALGIAKFGAVPTIAERHGANAMTDTTEQPTPWEWHVETPTSAPSADRSPLA